MHNNSTSGDIFRGKFYVKENENTKTINYKYLHMENKYVMNFDTNIYGCQFVHINGHIYGYYSICITQVETLALGVQVISHNLCGF